MPQLSNLQGREAPSWFVLTVKPQHELVAAAGLASKGFEGLAPTCIVRRRWSDRIKTLTQPLFRGYVFCRTPLAARTSILQTPGVRGFVSFGGSPIPVPGSEMEAILRITSTGLPIEPLAWLRAGERVRVIDGVLRGLEGTLLQCEGHTRVVVGIEMLQRSVSVEIDRATLQPVVPLAATFYV
ncbi:MAG: transcription termination/antitermination NusG family protein [Bryobacteraceae bacterium]